MKVSMRNSKDRRGRRKREERIKKAYKEKKLCNKKTKVDQ